MRTAALLARALELAAEAGAAVSRVYDRGGTAFVAKADDSPLTEADLASDRIIAAGLKRLDPATPAVSEEGDRPDGLARARRFWLVDPLDGTKEFLKRTDDFTVNIALIEDGRPILGVVLAPALDACWWAAEEEGAWSRERGGPVRRLRSRPATGAGGWVVAESRSHPAPELERFLSGLTVRARLKIGSSLKFCRVAEGAVDLYPRFGPTMEWDTAAGDCVYRLSGADAPRLSPLRYGKPGLRNPNFVVGGENLPRGLGGTR